MIRTGGALKLMAIALLAFSIGRWFSTTFFDFLWSSISAGALILLVVAGAFLWMSWTAEDLVAEKLKMDVWKLRSYVYIIGGGFIFGCAGSIIQWFCYTALPWIEARS